MKLKDIKKTIEQLALSQPNVNTFIFGDVYQLNTMKDVKYSAIAVTQNTHREDDEYRYYGLNIFYIDRNTNDNGNVLDNQSVGIEILDTLISDLEAAGVLIESDRTFQPFTENFNQLCSGVYVTVELAVEFDECGDEGINIVTSVNGRTGDVWVSEGGGTTYSSITESGETTTISNKRIVINSDTDFNLNARQGVTLNDSEIVTEKSLAMKEYVTQLQLNNELSNKATTSYVREYAQEKGSYVESDNVRRISVMSQDEYDALTYKFDDVLFVIID